MNTRLKIIGAAAVGLLLLYGFLVEPYWIEVKHLHLEDENIDASLSGKTALHLTDLHVVQIGKRERKVIDIIEETNPDYVFLTGDYVPWNGDYAPAWNSDFHSDENVQMARSWDHIYLSSLSTFPSSDMQVRMPPFCQSMAWLSQKGTVRSSSSER